METQEPYGIHLAWIQATNLLAPTNSAEPHRWHDVLSQVDFGFATDLFMTPTIQCCCDVFLPINTFIEHDSHVETLYGNNMGVMGAMNKIISVGDTKSDLEITLDLGKRLHPELFNEFGDAVDFHNEKLAPFGLTFEELRDMVTWQPGELRYKKYETGLLRRDHAVGFPTTTGRVELYAYMFEYLGEDPLPYYQEPLFFDKQEYKTQYPLILTTGARDWASFHSEHRQIDRLREITPDPIVEIHPDTAAEYGIEDGDWIYIENMFGKCKERARVRPTMKPGVIMASHGWWYPEEDGSEPNLFGVWKSNINSLIPNGYMGKMGFGSPYKSIICKIYKAND
jgi:anaerobic selenocysteine-containing dehydrogenase